MDESLEERLAHLKYRSWEWKDDPDLADLTEIMDDGERTQWDRGIGSIEEREDFLRRIEDRWRELQKKAGRTPRTNNPAERERQLTASLQKMARIIEEVERNNPVQVVVTSVPQGSGVYSSGMYPPPARHSKKYYRRVRQGFFAVVGLLAAIIFERINAPTWLVVLTLAVALICIAILPSVEKASRTARTMFWGALVLYSVFAGYVAIKAQPSSAIKAPQSKAPQSPSVAAPLNIPKGDERTFVDVDAAYFATLYRTHSTAQADIAAQAYIGKWIKVGGTVSDVTRDKSIVDSSESVRVVITFPMRDKLGMYAVSAEFKASPAKDAALILNREETITVVGKIRRISDMALLLDDCEIVP